MPRCPVTAWFRPHRQRGLCRDTGLWCCLMGDHWHRGTGGSLPPGQEQSCDHNQHPDTGERSQNNESSAGIHDLSSLCQTVLHQDPLCVCGFKWLLFPSHLYQTFFWSITSPTDHFASVKSGQQGPHCIATKISWNVNSSKESFTDSLFLSSCTTIFVLNLL